MTDSDADSPSVPGAAGAADEPTDPAHVVHDLAPDCTADDLAVDELYRATVNGVVDYGVFVDVSEAVSGLLHESRLEDEPDAFAVGDVLVVRLVDVRDDGDLEFAPAGVSLTDDGVSTVAVAPDRDPTPLAEIAAGDEVLLEAEVAQIKQTGGPTIFRVRDGTGLVPCAAFDGAGVRAHPSVDLGDAVRVVGRAELRDGSLQVEADDVTPLSGDEATRVHERVGEAIAARTEAVDADPLVDWPRLDPIRADLADVAQLVRRAVHEGRPIRIRHHSDGDGICAALSVQLAVERAIEAAHLDDPPVRHLCKRLPTKAPFYELEDVTRDLNFALESRERHGQQLPLLLVLDNGSTTEDTPAYRTLSHYDVPIVVVDHHHPDPDDVDPLVDAHVNPYLHDEEYGLTTGMLCAELAPLIAPAAADAYDLRHVPAVAGVADRSSAAVMDEYLALAADAGYDRDDLARIVEALDYAAHWLRYSEGRGLVTDVLGVEPDARDRHRELVDFLCHRATRDVDRQLAAATPHVEHERLASGAHCNRVDLDEFAHRFTYPAPGRTTAKLHDRAVDETGEPTVTVGYGPDFAVIRSDGVQLDIPAVVDELTAEYPGAGVSGGGHLVVGSITFVEGRRDEAVDALIAKLGEAAVVEEPVDDAA